MKNVIQNSLLAFGLFIGLTSTAQAKNMIVIERNPSTGFSVVRTGKPNLIDFRELCRIGVRKMIVMSGNGSIEKNWADKECPGFEVIYDKKQSTKVPLSIEFLNEFDQHIAAAKAGGYGVAFRCNCGCHRTGRLAAYYKMKYQGIDAASALRDQRRNAPGVAWFLWRKTLKYQIRALSEYVEGRACTQKQKYCVIPNDRVLTEDELESDDAP